MNAYNHETSPLAIPGAETAKILVIRFKFIGDVVLTSVLCNTLKQTFPKARVDFLIQEASADLFVDHPYVDRVIKLKEAQRKNPFKYCKEIRKITAEEYDLVVDAQSTLKSELISLLARKRAICIGRKKRRRGYFYTHRVDATPIIGNKIEEHLKLLEPLSSMGFDVLRHDEMVINIPNRRRAHFRREMNRAGVDFDRPVFAFSVTAKLDFKKWRMDYLEEVVSHCMATFDAQIVLSAGCDKERDEVRSFVARLNNSRDVFCEIETRNLMDLAALFANCNLYIGNEGGPRHIAHAVGVPSVSIFSPSAKKSEWLPANSRHHQGVEWDDLVETSSEEKALIHQNLEVGGKHYRELYNKITPQPVIELIDDVTEFVGIPRLD